MAALTLQGEKLQEIAYSSESANAVLRVLNKRERLRHHTDISRFKTELKKNGERIVDSEYMKLWKDLEAAGIGSIVYGRNGRSTFFKWSYNLKTVAEAALQGKDMKAKKLTPTVPTQTALQPAKLKAVKPAVQEATDHRSVKSIFIQLRSNFNLHIRLPTDITRAELEVIIMGLKKGAELE